MFDREQLRRNRGRAAKNFPQYNFLIHESAQRLIEKITDLNRNFTDILEIGARDGFLSWQLANINIYQGKIRSITQTELSHKMLEQIKPLSSDCPNISSNSSVSSDSNESSNSSDSSGSNISNSAQIPIIHRRIIADEENLPFTPNQFDLIISNLNLHHINHLPQTLARIRQCLKKNGLFIASFFGGETLSDLRKSIITAELKYRNKAHPRIIPFIHIKDAGMLMQNAGFGLPVADSETVSIEYQDSTKLLYDLKRMGEGNILAKRSSAPLTKTLLKKISEIHLEKFPSKNGNITANFEIITVSGWKL